MPPELKEYTMNCHLIRATVLVCLLAPTVDAGLIKIATDDLLSVKSVTKDGPEWRAGFQKGERLALEILFNDATPDSHASSKLGLYRDQQAVLTLIGLVTGARQDYAGGVELQVSQNRLIIGAATKTSGIKPILATDIALTSKRRFFGNVNALSGVLSSLNARSFLHTGKGTSHTTVYRDGKGGKHHGMVMLLSPGRKDFSVSASSPSLVPEPASALMLLSGLGCLVVFPARRRRGDIQ